QPISPNLLARNFQTRGSGKVWVSDITYLVVEEGFLYLTVILDLYDRKVVGWSLSETLRTEDTVLRAWYRALTNRSMQKNFIFHSDRGVQYASEAFRNVLKDFEVRQSMSRKANCWDNAVAESFFKSLKTEAIYGHKLQNKKQMKALIFEYIEIWYNRQRRHSYLGYKTIVEVENQTKSSH
ncbi:MAG: IS3 family transposase, partial [Bacteroidota bacterium]